MRHRKEFASADILIIYQISANRQTRNYRNEHELGFLLGSIGLEISRKSSRMQYKSVSNCGPKSYLEKAIM